MKSILTYTILNLVNESAGGFENKKGIAFYTAAEILYKYLYEKKDIVKNQKLIFHSLMQILLDSLTTENYELILIDFLLTGSSVIISENY